LSFVAYTAARENTNRIEKAGKKKQKKNYGEKQKKKGGMRKIKDSIHSKNT
jgi:hypothetical protein